MLITGSIDSKHSKICGRFKGRKIERSPCQKRVAYNRINIVERIELLLLIVRIWRRTRVERLRRSRKKFQVRILLLNIINSIVPFLNNFNIMLENSSIAPPPPHYLLLNPHSIIFSYLLPLKISLFYFQLLDFFFSKF